MLRDESQELMSDLVRWELLHADEVDPHLILRQLSIAEVGHIFRLSRLVKKQFVCLRMIELELKYRRGELDGDWSFTKHGAKVSLQFSEKSETRYVPLQLDPLGVHA